jgi:general secretion pathway protein K
MPTVLKKTTQQHGAALITAMLLAALIVILSASWLARFDAQLRMVEVQRVGAQTRWLLRAATNWARVILSEHADAPFHLGEEWAVAIAPTRIADIAETQEAYFSGRMVDAQSRFNLYNWRVIANHVHSGKVNKQPYELTVNEQKQLEWGKRIMQACGLSSPQADAWQRSIEQTVDRINRDYTDFGEGNVLMLDTLPSSVSEGLSETVKACLETRLVWLDTQGEYTLTTVNINTVDMAVLAAHPDIGQTEAQRLLNARKSVSYIKDANNIQNSLGITNEALIAVLTDHFDVKSRHFLATGRVTMGRIDMMATSLLYLEQYRTTPTIVWTQAL